MLDAVSALLERSARAWDANDARAYADCFTDDATYIAFSGLLYRGRAEIETSHRKLFAGPLRGTLMSYSLVEARPIGTEAVSLVTRGEIGRSHNISLGKIQSYVGILDGEEWRFAHFQNTKRSKWAALFTGMAGREALPSNDCIFDSSDGRGSCAK